MLCKCTVVAYCFAYLIMAQYKTSNVVIQSGQAVEPDEEGHASDNDNGGPFSAGDRVVVHRVRS